MYGVCCLKSPELFCVALEADRDPGMERSLRETQGLAILLIGRPDVE